MFNNQTRIIICVLKLYLSYTQYDYTLYIFWKYSHLIVYAFVVGTLHNNIYYNIFKAYRKQ